MKTLLKNKDENGYPTNICPFSEVTRRGKTCCNSGIRIGGGTCRTCDHFVSDNDLEIVCNNPREEGSIVSL